jgi:hypothetical protein
MRASIGGVVLDGSAMVPAKNRSFGPTANASVT